MHDKQCLDCGFPLEGHTGACGYAAGYADASDNWISVADLRELIGRWRSRVFPDSHENQMRSKWLNGNADELEALLPPAPIGKGKTQDGT